MVSVELGNPIELVYAFVDPIARRAKKGAAKAGHGAADKAENAARGTFVDRPFDEHYWDAQALKCLDIKSVGIPQYDGIFASLLEKVSVDLRLWSIANYGKIN